MSEERQVDPAARVRELWVGGSVDDNQEFTYRWSHGYETLDFENGEGGGLHFAGSFHPGDGCCKGNPCRYCGSVTFE